MDFIALGTGTALIGFGQAAEATGHEDPIRNFANNLGISNKAYDTASEVIPFLTSLGCMGATSVLQFSALRSGASSAADTVANMSEHATEAEKRVISYETDVYSVYTKGSYNKAPKPNYRPLARDVAGDNRGAALKGIRQSEVILPSKPHKNGTVGHWETILDEVDVMKKSGDYKKIYVNKGLSNEIPGARPNRRPDVMGVRHNGIIDQVEVPSKTDDLLALRNRMKDNQKIIGNRAGSIKIREIDK